MLQPSGGRRIRSRSRSKSPAVPQAIQCPITEVDAHALSRAGPRAASLAPARGPLPFNWLATNQGYPYKVWEISMVWQKMLVASAAGLLAAGHVAPALSCSNAVRVRLTPRLAGVGRHGHVAMTFGDGPDPAGTPAVLAALERLGWHATFFLLGSQVAAYPALAADLAARGHEVAVHGYSHRSHLTGTPGAVRADVIRACEVIVAATGEQPRWFRPPYGVLSAGSVAATRVCGLRAVLWTASGRDWEPATPAQVTDAVVRDLGSGGTMLLHDSDCTSRLAGSWRATVDALPLLAHAVESSGWTAGPLREHGLE